MTEQKQKIEKEDSWLELSVLGLEIRLVIKSLSLIASGASISVLVTTVLSVLTGLGLIDSFQEVVRVIEYLWGRE